MNEIIIFLVLFFTSLIASLSTELVLLRVKKIGATAKYIIKVFLYIFIFLSVNVILRLALDLDTTNSNILLNVIGILIGSMLGEYLSKYKISLTFIKR